MSSAVRNAAPPGAAKRSKAPAGAFCRAPLALSLPQIDPRIDAEIPVCADTAWWARLALLWHDDIPPETAGMAPTRMVEAAVARWIDRVTGGRRTTMDFDVYISHQVDLALGWADAETAPGDLWYFAYSHTGTQFWSMLRLDELETEIAGLGETAWHLIGSATARTLGGITPNTAMHRAECCWWYGQSDQEGLVEELQAMGLSEAEIAEYPSIEWWENAYPDLVRIPERRLSGKRLAQLAGSGETEFVRECAALLAEISQLIDRNALLPGLHCDLTDGEPAHLGIVLTHAADDMPMRRLTDDWYEMVNQSGGEGWHDAYGIEAVGFDRMAFRRWKTRMERGLKLFAALDRFIELAGVRIGD